MKNHFYFLIACFLLPVALQSQPNPGKPRTIVTTDGEIDDVDSFIRFLLYANEMSVEGLVYSSSQWHWKGDGKGTKFTSELEMSRNIYGERTELRWVGTQWIQDLLVAYEKIYPKLSTHAPGYPSPAYLRSLVRVGNIDFEGEMDKDTDGSNFIREKLLDATTEPIYLQAWGGTNTIARALKSIEDEFKKTARWQEIYKKVCAKAVIYIILDQDATYRKYISVAYPDLQVLYNSKQFWSLAYFWQRAVPKPWHPYLEGKFMGDHLINGHGDLLKMYYSYGDGQKQEGDPDHVYGDPARLKNGQWGSFGKYDFISEGDSPAFLHLLDFGLGNLEHPNYGGWSGRLTQSATMPSRWEDADELAEFNPFTQKLDTSYAQTRWIDALQLDFAARADWCVNDVKNANHPPVVRLLHGNQLSAAPGSKVKLQASASDPDGDKLSYRWWQYEEVDSYGGKVAVKKMGSPKTAFVMPKDIRKGENIHLILEVRDKRELAMTRYQRVVVSAE